MSKECVDDTSIGTALTESSIDVFNTEESLEEENNLMKQLFEQPDEVL